MVPEGSATLSVNGKTLDSEAFKNDTSNSAIVNALNGAVDYLKTNLARTGRAKGQHRDRGHRRHLRGRRGPPPPAASSTALCWTPSATTSPAATPPTPATRRTTTIPSVRSSSPRTTVFTPTPPSPSFPSSIRTASRRTAAPTCRATSWRTASTCCWPGCTSLPKSRSRSKTPWSLHTRAPNWMTMWSSTPRTWRVVNVTSGGGDDRIDLQVTQAPSATVGIGNSDPLAIFDAVKDIYNAPSPPPPARSCRTPPTSSPLPLRSGWKSSSRTLKIAP